MTTDPYRFAHRDMLFAGLTWLKDRIELAAASIYDTDPLSQHLWITLNEEAPKSGAEAWTDMIAGRKLYSEEMFSERVAIFRGPEYVGQDVALYVNAVGSMRGKRDGTAECACFLEREFTKEGDPDSLVSTLLYIVPVTSGSVEEELPVCIGPWCIKNFQPTGDCEMPSACCG